MSFDTDVKRILRAYIQNTHTHTHIQITRSFKNVVENENKLHVRTTKNVYLVSGIGNLKIQHLVL